MIGQLAHRGPERRTWWFSQDHKLALAHAQLSFFKGRETQPVCNRRNTIFVVCNGEIYNHQELARLIRQSGFDLEDRADIGVIPYLYELFGTDSFAKLRGEFALALYDCERRSLYLVRDRFGVKPLYFHATANSVVFGSEIKALFANTRVPRNLDYASLAARICGIPLPGSTSFSAIREVRPASFVKLNEGRISEQSYWSPRLEPATHQLPLKELAQDFLGRFDEAVRVRLHGDYPVGAYLSGGIDSSAVLASMVHAGVKFPKAFTISYPDRRFDESRAAAKTASSLGAEHYIVEVRDLDIAHNFLHSIWHSEIPVINCHGTAKFLLSRAASAHVKAVMTGEGADELFAGYPYFGDNSPAGTPAGARSHLASWRRVLRSGKPETGLLQILRQKDIDRLEALFGCTPHVGTRALSYARLIRPALDRDFRRYFSPLAALQALGQQVSSAAVGVMTPTNTDRFLALCCDLPAYILNFLGDRQEMAHSIEGRVPFLDDDVVAFASSLGEEALIGEAAGKRLIREAFAKRLPPETLTMQKRMFLAPPTAVDTILESDWAQHMLSKSVTDAVGVFDWRKLTWLTLGLRIAPAHTGIGSAMRTFMIFIISLHALHELFIVGRSRS